MKKKNNQENALKKKFLKMKDADIKKLWKSKNETRNTKNKDIIIV